MLKADVIAGALWRGIEKNKKNLPRQLRVKKEYKDF